MSVDHKYKGNRNLKSLYTWCFDLGSSLGMWKNFRLIIYYQYKKCKIG